jgi:hypothetical protein
MAVNWSDPEFVLSRARYSDNDRPSYGKVVAALDKVIKERDALRRYDKDRPRFTSKEPLYYIQCTSNYAYDYILWWRKGSAGYTHNLAEAGLYTAEEAKGIVDCRGEEVAWAKEHVEHCQNPAVSIETLRGRGFAPFLDRKKMPQRRARRKPDAGKCKHCGRFFSLENTHPDDDDCKRCR